MKPGSAVWSAALSEANRRLATRAHRFMLGSMRLMGWLVLVIAACNAGSGGGGEFGDGGSGSTSTDQTSSTPADATGVSATGGTGPKLDVGTETEGPAMNCKVVDEMDAPGTCRDQAPPASFEPDIQWTWTGPDDEEFSFVMPLVANLTDDNDDGEIDLCDIPDILVNAYASDYGLPPEDGQLLAHLFVLDGATGLTHFRLEPFSNRQVTPAIGDIDGDGLPEIVGAGPFIFQGVGTNLIAWEHDGTVKWESAPVWQGSFDVAAIGLADLDNDGDVEIYGEDFVVDHTGALVWAGPGVAANNTASAAADLDGDGDLEIVVGHVAYHHDGSVYYTNTAIPPGYPQIADLDDDPEPEVLVTANNGLNVLEHDGTTKYAGLRPTGDTGGVDAWRRPATIHDFNGDGAAEYAMSSASHYTVYEADGTIVWSADVDDFSGVAAGTAFDFLGDATAEAMFADEQTLFIFDDMGGSLLEVPRLSRTLIEYPVVADVDNDGSAEIVVTSSDAIDGMGGIGSPTVQVVRDAQDRWIQARRIWNQHTYHVTNVREDSTIPEVEPPSWQFLNTYRTNAQISGATGEVCKPRG